MYEREFHKWTDEGKPISPAFGQNYGSIKCSLKEKTNNLVASQPQDIVISTESTTPQQRLLFVCHLCGGTEDTH